MTRRDRPRPPVLALALILLLPTCGSGRVHLAASSPSGAPDAVVTLAMGTDRTGRLLLPDARKTVTLRRGQVLTVQRTATDGPGYWHQSVAGDPSVIVPAGSVTTSPCAGGQVGCGDTERTLYRGSAPGSTVIVWTFSGLGPAVAAPAQQPRERCSSGSSTPRCPVGQVRITVTVEPD